MTVGGSSVRSVKLSWDASVPASKEPADAVKGYNVYRHEPHKKYEQINRVLIHETGCTDYAVTAGRTYSYQVEAVSRLGAISKPSNTADADVRPR